MMDEVIVMDAGFDFSLVLQGGRLGWGAATSELGCGDRIPTRVVLKHKSISPWQGEVGA
jgi:hypothetical protein